MTLKLNGSSSGYTAIDAPAAAGSNTLVLPANNGSANQCLKNSSTPGILEFGAAGKIINYAQTFKKDTDSDSVAQGAVSDALISLSYAAASSSNKLLLSYVCYTGISSSVNTYGYLYIGGSVSTYIGDQGESSQKRATSSAVHANDARCGIHAAQVLIASPSTSSTAYDFRLSHGNNGTETVYINRDGANHNYNYYARFVSSLTILELAP